MNTDTRNFLISPHNYRKSSEILFPFEIYEELITTLGWEIRDWSKYWIENKYPEFSKNSFPVGINYDWFWGLALPLLTDIENLLKVDKRNFVIGISGLPGCGKSTLASWIECICIDLGWPVKAISLDDFYLPANEMQIALKNNPWNVPRGIPGSHSMDILFESIHRFLNSGEILCPIYDKSLRNGSGDRKGWDRSYSKILILEGWFVGCNPDQYINQDDNEQNTSPLILTEKEKEYQKIVLNNLHTYLPIWQKLSRVWHIKSEFFRYTYQWKIEQENNMYIKRGASLKGRALQDFLRMISTCIPTSLLNNIECDVLSILNQKRRLIWIGNNK